MVPGVCAAGEATALPRCLDATEVHPDDRHQPRDKVPVVIDDPRDVEAHHGEDRHKLLVRERPCHEHLEQHVDCVTTHAVAVEVGVPADERRLHNLVEQAQLGDKAFPERHPHFPDLVRPTVALPASAGWSAAVACA